MSRSPWAHIDDEVHEDLDSALDRTAGTYWEAEDVNLRSRSRSISRANSVTDLKLDFSKIDEAANGVTPPRSPRTPNDPASAGSSARQSPRSDRSGGIRRTKSFTRYSPRAVSRPKEAHSTLSPYSPKTPFPMRGGYKLYKRRWFVLGLFASLTFVNRLICFAFAPVADFAEEYYSHPTIHLSWLIDLFFIVYVLTAFPSASLVDKWGLRYSVMAVAWIQAFGAALRLMTLQHNEGADFYMVLFGQCVVALGQCVLLNSPPLLSNLWFGADERVTATTISLEANTLGIAGAYLFSPFVVTESADVRTLNVYLAVICAILALLTCFFPDAPPTPPTRAVHMKEAGEKVQNLRSIVQLLMKQGFAFTVMCFAVSETILNVFATFMSMLLSPKGYSTQAIGWAGTFYIVAGMAGSAFFGWLVDKTKHYKVFQILVCIGTLISLVVFTIFDAESDPPSGPLIASIIVTGFFTVPMQPIAMELAAECTFPASESSFGAIQQVAANVLSGAIVPITVAMEDGDSLTRSNWLMVGVQAVTTISFLFFKATYLRLETEENRSLLGSNRKNARHVVTKSIAPPKLRDQAADPTETEDLLNCDSEDYSSLMQSHPDNDVAPNSVGLT